MSMLDDDPVFHKRVSQMGGYGITQDYLDNLVDRCFPVKSSYKVSDALKFDDFYDPEDIYETSYDRW